jgi:hypothetical protein
LCRSIPSSHPGVKEAGKAANAERLSPTMLS